MSAVSERRARVRDVRTVLQEYFQLEAAHTSSPSATGAQLARIRLGIGTDDGADWRASAVSSHKNAVYADAIMAVRTLTQLELELCRLRYWAVEVGDFDQHTRRGGYEVYKRNVWESDLHRAEIGEKKDDKWRRVNEPLGFVPMLDVNITHAGEEQVLEPAYIETADGKQAIDGRAVVRGVRTRLTTYEAISEATRAPGWRFNPMNVHAVRWALRTACEKVYERIFEMARGKEPDA